MNVSRMYSFNYNKVNEIILQMAADVCVVLMIQISLLLLCLNRQSSLLYGVFIICFITWQ